jgi:hypothetical protein
MKKWHDLFPLIKEEYGVVSSGCVIRGRGYLKIEN